MFTLKNPTKLADLSGYTVYSHKCFGCGTFISLTVTPAQMFAYNQGATAQEVLADHSPVIRERFISGVCGTCWDTFSDFDS